MNLFDVARQTPPAVLEVNLNFDSTETADIFARGDYQKIINSSTHFWNAFCCESAKQKFEDAAVFSISLKAKRINISGDDRIVKDIQKCVEKIRELFVNGYAAQKSFLICPLVIDDFVYFKGDAKAQAVDLKNYLTDPTRIKKLWFTEYIFPSLEGLSHSLRANFSIHKRYKEIYGPGWIQSGKFSALKIDWIAREHFVYSIPPISIPPRADTQKALYLMYKDRPDLCDLSLEACDGVVKIHSAALYIYGGEVMQAMFKPDALRDKKVCFKEFSLTTVMAFVDFIYLGQAGLMPEAIQQSGVSLTELLKLAYSYQLNNTLIDCCINLLNLLSLPKDAQKINHLAQQYENEHLKKLGEHLLIQQLTGVVSKKDLAKV